MPIQHPDRVGSALTALKLLSDRTHRITVNGGKTIKVSIGPSSVIVFDSEEEFMIWVLDEIKVAASRELHWFKSKYPNAYETVMHRTGKDKNAEQPDSEVRPHQKGERAPQCG